MTVYSRPVTDASAPLREQAARHLLGQLAAPAQAEFGPRLQQHLPVLLDRLQRLYGQHPDFEAWWFGTWARICDRITARSAALQALDAQRRSRPDWFLDQRMIGYSTYVDRFGGTLLGLIERIPHLKRLGVTYLHLLPFLKARAGANDGGFAVASFDAVAPDLGTIADLETLTTALRREGIRLCADFVLNHVADQHPWALAAQQGDSRYRQFFHCLDDRDSVDQYEQHLIQVFPQTAPGSFTWNPAMQTWVWTTFYPYQWDLNYANPEVFAEVALALLGLANHGIDVFRLDSTGYLWKRLGTDCMNQPEAHWILQALRAIMDIAAPAVLLKAEAIVPTSKLPPYFGVHALPAPECHLAYHSSLMSASWLALYEQSAAILRQVLQATPTLPPACTWLTYVRCHDDIGWNVLRPDLTDAPDGGQARLRQAVRFFAGESPGSYAQGRSFQAGTPGAVHGTNGMAAALVGLHRAEDEEQGQRAIDRYLVMLGLACTVGGIPMLYMGDELGQDNDWQTQPDLAQGIDGRQLHRPVFALPPGGDVDQLVTDTPLRTRLMQRVYARVRTLLETRRRLASLAGGHPLTLLPGSDAAHLVFQRGALLIEQNWSTHPLTGVVGMPAVLGPLGSVILTDELTGERIRLASKDGPERQAMIQLQPWQQRWWSVAPDEGDA